MGHLAFGYFTTTTAVPVRPYASDCHSTVIRRSAPVPLKHLPDPLHTHAGKVDLDLALEPNRQCDRLIMVNDVWERLSQLLVKGPCRRLKLVLVYRLVGVVGRVVGHALPFRDPRVTP